MQPNECADLSGHPGTAYQYQYDQMGRLSGMQENICYWDGTNCQWYWQTQVMAAYGPANEMTSLSYYGTNETRTYNNLLQLTRQTVPGRFDTEYVFPRGPEQRPDQRVDRPHQRPAGELHL